MQAAAYAFTLERLSGAIAFTPLPWHTKRQKRKAHRGFARSRTKLHCLPSATGPRLAAGIFYALLPLLFFLHFYFKFNVTLGNRLLKLYTPHSSPFSSSAFNLLSQVVVGRRTSRRSGGEAAQLIT